MGAVRFQYSDFMYSGGFNNTASHGGPIRPGLQVRVCYLPGPSDDENVILRLEAAGLLSQLSEKGQRRAHEHISRLAQTLTSRPGHGASAKARYRRGLSLPT